MTPQCVAVRHVSFEDLGIWEPVLSDFGYEVSYLDAGVDPLEPVGEADLAILLGGPIGVADGEEYPVIGAEIEALTTRIADDRATIGVCLGAQLLAVAMGGSVTPGNVEIGWGEVELSPVGDRQTVAPLADVPVLHWHADSITPPPGADVLASTDATPCQAFAMGSALGLQFHIEVDADRIEQWLIGHNGELSANGIDPRQLRQASRRHCDRAARAGRDVLSAYLTGHRP